jgi:hypothetical protein
MSMWRCPHCGTPQPEAARCWVCHRSSTTCSTCRHFRRSLAASVGFCGLDARRAPLVGTEHRGCWEEGASNASPPAREAAAAERRALDPAVARLRPEPLARPGIVEGFVPIEHVERGPRTLRATDHRPVVPPPEVIDAVDSWAGRETLFGDLDG